MLLAFVLLLLLLLELDVVVLLLLVLSSAAAAVPYYVHRLEVFEGVDWVRVGGAVEWGWLEGMMA